MSCRKNLAAELASIEQQGSSGGSHYWRSLDELSNTDAFQQLMRREFPSQASVWPSAIGRREFLTLMSASLALAGISGCSVRPAPSTDLVPYVRSPEEIVPGRPLFYATAMSVGAGAVGLLVESHMGRPTKIEGNPDHPASLGASGIFQQAAVLSLYDPDRSQAVTYLGQESTWERAMAALQEEMTRQGDQRGVGVRILTGTIVSPTAHAQLEQLLDKLPAARWHVYEPIHSDSAWSGAELAFGKAVAPVYDFLQADVVVSLDADFLGEGPAQLRYAADFMSRRRIRTDGQDAAAAAMSRLYVVEGAVSRTGAKADHRLAIRPSAIERLARAVAAELGVIDGRENSDTQDWIAAVARDLQAHRGRSLIIAGDRQSPAVHLLAHAINEHLGNVGHAVNYIAPIAARLDGHTQSLGQLVDDMSSSRVSSVLILGANPVLTAPADMQFAKALDRVPLRVHLGLFRDETSRRCHWHLPEAHFLEAWSDARAYDGTASIVQPLIEPLYQGRSIHEVLALVAGSPEVSGRELVRAYWKERWPDVDESEPFELRWETALHDGVIGKTQSAPQSVTLVADWQTHLQPEASADLSQDPVTRNDLELNFAADPTIYDGRFANNGWLQELPKPVTQLTWGNAAIMSPATAERLGLKAGRPAHGGDHGGYSMPVVELRLAGRTAQAPCWIMPGHADGTVTVYLGNGRQHAGRVGGSANEQFGFDAYALRTSAEPWHASGLQIIRTDVSQLVTCTQHHHSMDNREVVRSATLATYRQQPDFAAADQAKERREKSSRASDPLTLYEPFDYSAPKRKWGMAIDLTTCIGCNACVVACQAENNIPVVGKQQVAAGREMHWLRVDRYIGGPADDPNEFHFQPVPCMHCENAPCEYVCPVEATVHSDQGLNDMIYNRCVGTRFCSNNCPYKVRRFNFLAYSDYKTESLRLQYNPDVTVRSRGVMEKCTYCVQRIRRAEIDSDVEGRAIVDGEILTACQAACPTRAIVFGDINDAHSEVRRLKDSPLDYGLLEDLNTVPRTTYLASVRNPNPKLEKG